jgi:hypothetical protein
MAGLPFGILQRLHQTFWTEQTSAQDWAWGGIGSAEVYSGILLFTPWLNLHLG